MSEIHPLDKLCSHVNAEFTRGDYTYKSPVDITSVAELAGILCALYVADDRRGAGYYIWLTDATTGERVAEFSVYLLDKMNGPVKALVRTIEMLLQSAYDMATAEPVQLVEWEDLL